MFYSPFYLQKSGRFGLIWLAATQTKILSRRELATIDISTICSDIFTHIPGLKEKGSRSSRFSLYLCCQLMYGSAKVLLKQWDILLVDAQTLCRKCTDTPSSTKDIDMALNRQAVVCIESNVPRDQKDVNFDPYFGAYKESMIDVESMLSFLESLSEGESRVIRLESMPMPVQPELGSPHSVLDPREIQIPDVDAMPPMVDQMQGEQDLPKMDIESFLSISRDESFLEIQEQLGIEARTERHELYGPMLEQQHAVTDGMLETEDRNVSLMRDILMDALPQTDISVDQRNTLPTLEETPMTKPTSGMPAPPHKPRMDKPKRQRDPNRNESRFQDICNSEVQTSFDDSYLRRQQEKEKEKADDKGHGLDWAQKNAPTVDLPPISGPQTPLRKKKPHKLVIDQCLMISRSELIQHMEDTSDTVTPLEIPVTANAKNIYREPALNYLKHKAFAELFTKNCKFGLRMDDTGSEPDSLPSPRLADFLSRKRARGAESTETPASKIPRPSTSEVPSMEKARDRTTGSLSESVDRNISHSLVGEDSAHHTRSSTGLRGQLNLSSDQDVSKDGSILEREVTLNLGGVLTTCPEERELVISPIRHLPELAEQNIEAVRVPVPDELVGQTSEISPSLQPELASITSAAAIDSTLTDSADTPRSTVYKLVENNLRSRNDWTTFQAICPPASCSKRIAASMFHALCAQIARGKLCARQDEPYTSIFIWVPDFTLGLAA